MTVVFIDLTASGYITKNCTTSKTWKSARQELHPRRKAAMSSSGRSLAPSHSVWQLRLCLLGQPMDIKPSFRDHEPPMFAADDLNRLVAHIWIAFCFGPCSFILNRCNADDVTTINMSWRCISTYSTNYFIKNLTIPSPCASFCTGFTEAGGWAVTDAAGPGFCGCCCFMISDRRGNQCKPLR